MTEDRERYQARKGDRFILNESIQVLEAGGKKKKVRLSRYTELICIEPTDKVDMAGMLMESKEDSKQYRLLGSIHSLCFSGRMRLTQAVDGRARALSYAEQQSLTFLRRALAGRPDTMVIQPGDEGLEVLVELDVGVYQPVDELV